VNQWTQVDKGEFQWNTSDGFRYLVWEDLSRHDWYAETGHNHGWQKINPKKLVYRSDKEAKLACLKHWKERKK